VEPIGEGGMGSVWLSHQSEPVKRTVAVKLIKAGMDSRQVLARFEAERQALALMDHPNIAKVLDGGLHDGRPFFVMELVKGVPITEFCDARRLTPKERLELFVPVCQAIQHAHQKGIIHRDIKPNNVLVALYDDKPVVKVIDFGVAKATGGQLSEHTLATGFGAVVGTPQYMSPEQATFNNLDVDTRSDVYSLGVLLYELLTGSPPFSKRNLEKHGLLEILRVVREEEPPRPSTKLSTADALPSLSASRGTEPKKLTGLLRNELDWIVMKALEKDRARRYDTANGLAADVNRFLNGEEVHAHPPGTVYRVKKFVRRNRGQVFAASLVLLALLAGIAGTTWGLVKAKRQERIALDEMTAKEVARKAESEQREIAEAKARDALKAADEERLARHREAEHRTRAEKARDRTREVLDAMTSSVTATALGTQPAVSPEQKQFLTGVLMYYREFAGEKADDEKSRARTAYAATRVTAIEAQLGRKEHAISATRTAVDGFRALVADFPSEPKYRESLAANLNILGHLHAELGNPQEAQKQYLQAITIQEKLAADFPDAPDHRRALASTHNNLGLLLAELKQPAEAEKQHLLALTLLEKLAADFPHVPAYQELLALSHNNLGWFWFGLGKHPAAEEQYRKALAIRERLFSDAPDQADPRRHLAFSHNGLGNVLAALGRREAAEEQYRKALAIREKLTNDFPAVLEHQLRLGSSYSNFGLLVLNGGQAGDSLAWFDKAVATLAPAHRSEPRDATVKQVLRNSHRGRARAYGAVAKHAEAVKDWDRVVELSSPEERPAYRANRATSQLRAGRVAEAVAEVAELTKSPNWDANQWYDFARVYAVAGDKLADKNPLHADHAMQALHKAVQAGYKDAAHMTKDTDLDPLRDREDFKKLLSSLRPKEVAPPPRAVVK
ncbi:MAG TPA: protein kinase, partial [Gemmataceae bacterium]|nr:protein kinase [Gemmataceae bacterium]